MKKKLKPYYATISITDRCNSRCTFCKIWDNLDPHDLDPDCIDKLPKELMQVNLTGGEPFLHKDIEVIVEKLVSRDVRIIINTNGLIDLKKYLNILKNDKIGIRFSLDGVGIQHDTLRGVNGNFSKVIEQIKFLKSSKIKNIGIASTFSDINIKSALQLYKLSKIMKIDFTMMAATNSEIYYGLSDNQINHIDVFESVINEIIKNEVKSLNFKRLGKAIYLSELAAFLQGKVNKIMCPAAYNYFYLSTRGEVYACNMRNLLLGNLMIDDFKTIWLSCKADEVRGITSPCFKPCWTMCNAKPIMIEHKLRYFFKLLWRLIYE